MPIKKIAFFSIIVVSVFIINNLVHSIYTLLQKKELTGKATHELQVQKKEHEDLEKKLAQAKNPQFIEEEARDKLFLAKPGEGVIVIQKGVLHASSSSQPKPQDTRPNWKKWWDVFF